MADSKNKKVVTVLGALGAQGGSVVHSLLADNEAGNNHHHNFMIRAVTRSVDSDAAKALKDKGVEVVVGDTKQPESLSAAFKDADAAFIVVNFWDPEIMLKEEKLTRAILDVAKQAGIKHCLYASLADVEKVSNGKLNVPPFTMKAKCLEYAKSLGFEYVTAIEAAMYYTNWFTFMGPKKQDEDGSLVWKLPAKGKISSFDAFTGTGSAAVAAIKDPEKYNNKFILLEAEALTVEEMVDMILKKLNKKGRFEYVPPDVFAKFGFPGADEMAEMFKWLTEYGYYGPETADRKVSSGKEASGPGKLLKFQEWLDTGAYEKFTKDW